jgi:hypothetical protein
MAERPSLTRMYRLRRRRNRGAAWPRIDTRKQGGLLRLKLRVHPRKFMDKRFSSFALANIKG